MNHPQGILAPGGIAAPLDPAFLPAMLTLNSYMQAVRNCRHPTRLLVAFEREDGLVTRGDIDLLPPDPRTDHDTFLVLDRHIKFLLWARGAWKIILSGPMPCCDSVKAAYSPAGARAFDTETMGKIYDRPLTVEIVKPDDMPDPRESGAAIGGHTDGCRVGFDLGASDYKVAAVQDGKPLYSDEFPWDPKSQTDPEYHFRHIMDGIRKAASRLPRLDAIGGSTAGILVHSRIKVASLFRGVPAAQWPVKVTPIFERVRDEWRVPFEVANDGDVTALAGAMSLGRNSMLGVAMGSSEAAGFLDGKGRITGWQNELAFAPVDMNMQSPPDEWSGDHGVGAMYFSQQAVNKLAPAADIRFPSGLALPERLKQVQELAAKGHDGARKIFETIGVYLGYTIPYYEHYYDFENILVLGRVTSGEGGNIVIEKARRVLAQEFPKTAERIALHVPDDKSRRVGQAVAAASLPKLEK